MRPVFVLLVTLFASLANARSSSAAAEKCVIDICGSKNFLLNTRGAGDFLRQRPDDVRQVINRNLPLMEEIMDAETEYNLRKLSQIEKFQNIFTSGSLNTSESVMVGLAAVQSFDLSFLNGTYIRKENGEDRIVRSKFFKKLSGVEARKREWLADVLDAFLSSTWNVSSHRVENQPFEFVFKILNVEPRDVPIFARKCSVAALAIRTELGRRAIDDRDLELYEKMAAGEELNSFEQKSFVSSIGKVFRLHDLLEGDTRTLLARTPFSVSEILELNKQKIAEFKFGLTSPESLRSLRAGILNSCSNNIASSILSAPTAEQNRSAFQMTNALKVAAVAVASRYLSGRPLEAAKDALNNARFILPTDRATTRANIDHYLASVAKDARNLRSLFRLRDPEEERSDLLLKMIQILATDKMQGAKATLFPLLHDACNDLAPRELTDAALTKHGLISISWQSALWPAYGAGVMAHELGHIVLRAVDMKRDLMETITCQQKQKATFYGAAASANNDVEDFADNFSLTVQRELNKTWPYVQNLGCLLQSVDAEKGDFSEDAFDLTEDFGEGHSSGIYRLLHQQVGRGGLPAS